MTWKEYETAIHPERVNPNRYSPSGMFGCPPDIVDDKQLMMCTKGCKKCWAREAPGNPPDYLNRLRVGLAAGLKWTEVPEE